MPPKKKSKKKEPEPSVLTQTPSSSEKPWFRSWPEGVPRSIEYPEASLSDLLKSKAEKYPSKTAILYFDKPMTYRELDLASDRFATALSDLGVRKGEKGAF